MMVSLHRTSLTVSGGDGSRRLIRYAGAFFPSSQKLFVAGGVFTSTVTNNLHEAPSLPSGMSQARRSHLGTEQERLDFRMIPLGDIDPRREKKLNRETGVVERPRRCIRSVYSAKIRGQLSDMTVALYQGEGAEEVGLRIIYRNSNGLREQGWQEDISKISWLRQVGKGTGVDG
jgi:hypothetical protein